MSNKKNTKQDSSSKSNNKLTPNIKELQQEILNYEEDNDMLEEALDTCLKENKLLRKELRKKNKLIKEVKQLVREIKNDLCDTRSIIQSIKNKSYSDSDSNEDD
jgi:predicted  nucleic acid-binding Zn-ribbon protein